MRERIIIKSRTYTTSNTGQRSLDATTDVLETWVFRIRNSEPTDLLTKSNFITWRNKDYSIVSISAQESYQRIVELVCNVIE